MHAKDICERLVTPLWLAPRFAPLRFQIPCNVKRKSSSDTKSGDATVTALLEVTEAAQAGICPVLLDSIWVNVNAARVCVLPLVKGAHSPSRYGELETTEDFKQYECCVVDDSDGCSETDSALMQLKNKFKTPEAAMPSYVRALVAAGKVQESEEARVVSLWSSWLSGCNWRGLAGEFVSAHEVPDVMMRSIAPKKKLARLEIARYSFQHIEHEDFLESLGIEFDDTSFSGEQISELNAAFRSSFVCIWKSAGVDCSVVAVQQAVKQAEEQTKTFEQLCEKFQKNVKKPKQKK